MAKSPEYIVVHIPIEPREPTILEMMIILKFFMHYGRMTPGENLIAMQLADMPDEVNAYWLWRHMRDQDER